MSLHVRSDFYVCPNPLGMDTYTICENDCAFCFIKSYERGWQKKRAQAGLAPISTKELRNVLTKARSEKKYHDPVIQAIRYGLPVTVGRKSEPFCKAEETYHATRDALKVLDEFDIPFIVETRETRHIVETMSKMTTKCGVNVSMLLGGGAAHDRMEPGTSEYTDRWEMIGTLKAMGMYVGLITEPFIFGLTEDWAEIEKFAMMASSYKVDHVNVGELRVTGDTVGFANRLAMAGVDLVESIRRTKDGWVPAGRKLFETFREHNVPISSPDWVNFFAKGSCYSCCGLDKFHSSHHFTFQHALELIQATATADWDTMLKCNPFGPVFAEKFRKIWNGDPRYYGLTDVKDVVKLETDENGNAVYGWKECQKSLAEAFA